MIWIIQRSQLWSLDTTGLYWGHSWIHCLQDARWGHQWLNLASSVPATSLHLLRNRHTKLYTHPLPEAPCSWMPSHLCLYFPLSEMSLLPFCYFGELPSSLQDLALFSHSMEEEMKTRERQLFARDHVVGASVRTWLRGFQIYVCVCLWVEKERLCMLFGSQYYLFMVCGYV